MRLNAWLHYHQDEIVFAQTTWMGVPAQKNPLDAWIYQEIIFAVKPDIILEIGSYAGGSTLYFAHLLDILGTGKSSRSTSTAASTMSSTTGSPS